MAASGNYIVESDVDNWPDGYSEAQKQAAIDRAEDLIEQTTHDYFYAKTFTDTFDGNGKDRLFLNYTPDILSITEITISGVLMSSSLYAYDKNAVFQVAVATAQCKAIEGITLSSTNPVSINLTAHGFITGETARLVLVKGISPSLDGEYVTTKTDADNFTLNGTDSSDYSGSFTSGTACFAMLAELHYLMGAELGIFAKGLKNIQITGTYGWASCPAAIKQAAILLCKAENDPTLYSQYSSALKSEKLGDYSYTLADGGKQLTGIDKVDKLILNYIRRKLMLGAV